ncbi:MAG TPA: caspase family protein, partial [Thermoanaerobaculia bacterium]
MSPPLRALLIGAGHYFPNRLPDGNSYSSLEGAVRDVARMERYLREEIGLAPERISKLTATASPDGGPPEPREQWPTYENMVAAFRRLLDEAAPGEAVFVHYSGHGGRTPTIVPDLKGSVPIDEALVPCDIGDPGSRYLRDVELARLIQDLVGKGLFVTLVLDCCHSAGAARGPRKAVKRGLQTIDRTPRLLESLVATREELAESWSRRQGHRPADGPVMRGLSVKSWFPDPQGYVLVAACRPQESAFEFPFEGDESQGALTYHLLNALQRDGAEQTCKRLQDRVQAGVRIQFSLQTPMLLGDASRTLFGLEKAAPRYEINVMDVRDGRVLLNIGEIHGIREGAQFAIYSSASRVAVAEINQLGATESWARIVQSVGSAALESGTQAVPLDAGALGLRRGVSVGREPALDRVQKAIKSGGRGFLRLAEDGSAGFRVAVNGKGEYEIQDGQGQPIPH